MQLAKLEFLSFFEVWVTHFHRQGIQIAVAEVCLGRSTSHR